MEIVLRNTTIRKDAAYVIEYRGAPSNRLTGYWGRWLTYQRGGKEALRGQIKAAGEGYSRTMAMLDDLLREKLRKGCKLVSSRDLVLTAELALAEFGQIERPSRTRAVQKEPQVAAAPEVRASGRPPTRGAWLEL